MLGAELPKVPGGSNMVLYPASVRAGKDLQESLAASGFTVNRLHTYDTVSGVCRPADHGRQAGAGWVLAGVEEEAPPVC